MNKDYQKIFKDYGLSEKEAILYLSMLKTGYSSIINISKSSQLKRSTVYVAMEGLIKKNLVKISINGKKKHYIPENPQKTLDLLDYKKKQLEKIIPILQKDYNQKRDKPFVSFYEGRKEIEKIYKEVQKAKSEILWYGDASQMEKEFSEFYNNMISLQEKKDFVGMRDLVNNTTSDKKYARERNSNKNANIKVKILQPDLYFFSSDNIIFDNKMAILSIGKVFFAIVIESKVVVDIYRCMFEMAWRSAKTP